MECSANEKAERYLRNLHSVRSISTPRFAPEISPETILETIQQNAKVCYALRREDDDILNELIFSRDPETLSDRDIADLSAFAARLFDYARSEDAGAAYKIHELLLAAARSQHDTALIVKELYFCGITLHYINVRDERHGVNVLGERIHAYFVEGSGYISQYEELDTETRQYIIRCVGNLRLAIPRETPESCREYLRLFDRAMGILSSLYYQELDPEIPWGGFIYSMHMDRMSLLEYLRTHKDPDTAQQVLQSARYVYEHRKDHLTEEFDQRNVRVDYFYHAALFYAGKGSARAVIEDVLKMIPEAGTPDYSPASIDQYLMAAAYSKDYEKLLSARDRAELDPPLKRMRERVAKYLEQMPGSEYPRVAGYAIRELLEVQSDSMMDHRGMLGIILSGHRPTFVHSTMAAHLTRALIRQMIDTAPETLTGLMGCKDGEEVRARREELLQMAYDCGLYHDVGKSGVLMHIDTNARRLLDEEFLCIQSHPVIGYGLLCEAGYAQYLAPAALYHHCFYDGRGGYPGGLPPCPKEIKGIVDALTVADSLDAATDNIGRCYNLAKPFRTLVGELQAQCGSRYAPDVVKLFRDKAFCAELEQKLDAERKKVYLQVYHAAQ